MDKKYVDVEKANSIPTIKQQMRNINNNIEFIENSIKTVKDAIDDIEEEIEQLAANTVIFKAESKVIKEVQGTLPADADISKTRFVYYDGTNIVPLSISYTGSILFAKGRGHGITEREDSEGRQSFPGEYSESR